MSDGRLPSGTPAPWHAGERRLQTLAGVRERMEERGRVVLRDYMPDQHRAFFAERHQLFLSTLDPSGQPWATIIEGERGFVTSPTPRELAIRARLPEHDPAHRGLIDGAPVGLLGLEFETRRRNRMNGTLRLNPDGSAFSVDVTLSFGNCPKYIQARKSALIRPTPDRGARVRRSCELSMADQEMIRGADTLFIASRSAVPGSSSSEGLDVSHRGGRPGFVRLTGPGQIMFPDYRGNFAFNTLGNLLVDPRCGLLFVDFSTGATLQIAGRGRIVTDPLLYQDWPGAERAICIDVAQAVFTKGRSLYSWEFVGFADQFDKQGPVVI